MAAAADRELGAQWGISATAVLALAKEHLTEGEDFAFVGEGAQKRKTYTPAGLEKLASLLGRAEKKEGGDVAPSAPLEPSSPLESVSGEEKENPPPAPLPEPTAGAMLAILRLCPNPTWVTVRLPGGKTTAVRVKNSERLRPGQVLPCRRIGEAWHCTDLRVAPPLPQIKP